MLINILMIIFVCLALFVGGFFLRHLHKPFLVFHPESNPNLSGVVKFSGVSLIIAGLIAAAATISQNDIFISISLLIVVLDVVGIQLMLITFFPKNLKK